MTYNVSDKKTKRPIPSAATLLFLLMFAGLFGITLLGVPERKDLQVSGEAPVEPASYGLEFPEEIEPGQSVDYSRFRHGNEFHSRLPCLLCHRRDDNSPRMRFPGRSDHLPCAGCHALQFSDQSSPICTICHTNPQSGTMKRFPPLRSFGARFDHARHSRVNCATCHKPTGRGAPRSIPDGQNAHSTCFQCHTSSSPFSMSSCNVCHQPGRLVRVSESSRAFRIGFSHSRHLAERGMTCATCHRIQRGARRGRQVTSTATAMHFATARTQSCATCHNGTNTFGADDFANCKRCHQGNSFRF